jgi:hypothetical protein
MSAYALPVGDARNGKQSRRAKEKEIEKRGN